MCTIWVTKLLLPLIVCILFVAAGLVVSTAIKCYECTSGSVGVPGFGGTVGKDCNDPFDTAGAKTVECDKSVTLCKKSVVGSIGTSASK